MAALSFVITFVCVVVACEPVDSGVIHHPEEVKSLGDPRVEVSKVPWLAVVQGCSNFKCLGAIISRRWVLTVAHCTVGASATQLTVFPASKANQLELKKIQVEKLVNHERFLSDWHYDISALKTKESVLSDGFIKLPNSPPVAGSTMNLYETDGISLNVVEVTVEDSFECNDHGEPNKDLLLCGTHKKKISCQSLTTEVLVVDDVLVALRHEDVLICVPGSYLYASVTGLMEWIRNTTGDL